MTAGQILSQNLAAQKRQNSLVSIRSLAKKLDVSVAFLSRVLKDQTPFPVKRFKDFARIFRLDLISREQLLRSIADSVLKARVFDQMEEGDLSLLQTGFKPIQNDFELIHERDFELLTRWYFLAILDLTSCDNFVSDPAWIAKRLNLRVEVVANALDLLVKKGYLKLTSGVYRKRVRKMRFPAETTTGNLRNFHRQMILKADNILQDSTELYERRLINGIFFAADPAKLQEAKSILNKALYQIAELMAEGKCSEVYYVAGHLLPLTKK